VAAELVPAVACAVSVHVSEFTKVTQARLERDEIWRPGWGSLRESTPPEANRNCWASANVATGTYEGATAATPRGR
jgi:hypothetical protein